MYPIFRSVVGAVIWFGSVAAGPTVQRPTPEEHPFPIAIAATLLADDGEACPPRKLWIEPVYRNVVDRVWVPDKLGTATQRVFRPAIVVTETQNFYVPAGYDGSRFIPAHWETRQFQRIVRNAFWENVTREVVVTPGHYELVSRSQLVTPGHWIDLPVIRPLQ